LIPPPKKLGKIIKAQWEQFVLQKTAPEAKAISEVRVEQAKKNLYPHHLGSTGYAPKVARWQKILEDAVAAGTLDPLPEGCDEWAIWWFLARAGLSDEGKLFHPEMVEKICQKRRVSLSLEERMTNLLQS
jgi:hypothetical protein